MVSHDNSHPAETHSTTLRVLPFDLVRKLPPVGSAASGAAWIEAFTRAVLPFEVQVSINASEGRLVGAELAVGLVTQMIERFADRSPPDDRLSPEVLALEVVTFALRHDFALRLAGVPHPLRLLSMSQVAFIGALLERNRELVIAAGPTGSGKTHLAVAAGLNAVASGTKKKLILTRAPAPDAGYALPEFLRSGQRSKAHLAPLQDELRELLGPAELGHRVDAGLIEVIAVEDLPGRTFNDAFIVVDDAQNLSIPAMRMVVARIGQRSRMVVLGDPAAAEHAGEQPSGFPHLVGLVEDADVADVVTILQEHIVRNETVARLERLYALDLARRPCAA